jgi:N-acetylneuraminic acid mutarotase
LSFAERVAYQRAIEDVYWRHRIWPNMNPGPKPSLDAVMSQTTIQKKVQDYLRSSELLEQEWQKPIMPEQLQAEMDRMAQHTKQPEVLRELFAALGNDPFVIAECLARPVLSERLQLATVEWRKEPLESQRGNEAQEPNGMAAATANYTLPAISDQPSGCIDDSWTAITTTNAPEARAFHTAVWTGSEMIVWGGFDNSSNPLNTGGRYNPGTDSWMATTTTNAPRARGGHTAVWDGSEMIIWGGSNDKTFFDTGGRYNPGTDSWTATTTTNAPEARAVHTAVWTGSEMIVWGGDDFLAVFNTGARYNPGTDSWTATTTTNAPTARGGHTAVWTGSEMVVWGGLFGTNYLNTGGRYNPSTDSWMATTTTNAPTARGVYTAVWTGSEMIVWGGFDSSSNYVNTGGRYNPGTDSWMATTTTNAPTGRGWPTAVWTGSEMIVWGGWNDETFFDTGGRYNPSTDSWMATTTTNASTGRYRHTAVWTDSEMIVWGGGDQLGYLNTGGRYCAQASVGGLTLDSSFSRKTGRSGSFDVPLPGVEDRSDNKRFVIGFTFNNEVTGADSASTSCGTGGSLSVDPADPHTLLATFNGQTCNQQEITLTLTNVHDTLGNTLASAETSGCFLIGDVDGDGHVGNGDIGNIQGHLGEITDETNFRDDINADGRINNQDVQAARSHRRESCP